MSNEYITWAITRSEIDPAPRVVLIALANYAGEEGRCWPSVAHLATQLGMSELEISNHITDLEGLRVLTISNQRDMPIYQLPELWRRVR